MAASRGAFWSAGPSAAAAVAAVLASIAMAKPAVAIPVNRIIRSLSLGWGRRSEPRPAGLIHRRQRHGDRPAARPPVAGPGSLAALLAPGLTALLAAAPTEAPRLLPAVAAIVDSGEIDLRDVVEATGVTLRQAQELARAMAPDVELDRLVARFSGDPAAYAALAPARAPEPGEAELRTMRAILERVP